MSEHNEILQGVADEKITIVLKFLQETVPDLFSEKFIVISSDFFSQLFSFELESRHI